MADRSLLLATCVLTAPLLVPAVASSQGFSFPLNGRQELPTVSSPNTGSCSAVFEAAAGEDPAHLTIVCEHDVTDAVAAHIHQAPAGQNGPIRYAFADPANVRARLALSPEESAWLLTETLYVNIHSERNPLGELRGQMRMQSLATAGGDTTYTGIAGDQVVPAVDTVATGRCRAVVNPATRDLSVLCHHDVSDPVAAHIHVGSRGDNGPIVVDLGDPTSPIAFEGQVAADVVDDLVAGNLYYQVHSQAYPAGELRGQIDTCFAGATSLCLIRGRFQVEVDWRSFDGSSGAASAVRESLDTGIFYFFQPENAEILVKMLDGCDGSTERFWVFAAATTNLGFTLRVTDTRTGDVRTYENLLGETAAPILDTGAFATCP